MAGGRATVIAPPDMARVSLGVYVLDPDLRRAKSADNIVKGLLRVTADLAVVYFHRAPRPDGSGLHRRGLRGFYRISGIQFPASSVDARHDEAAAAERQGLVPVAADTRLNVGSPSPPDVETWRRWQRSCRTVPPSQCCRP
jgi:hypothetical protein